MTGRLLENLHGKIHREVFRRTGIGTLGNPGKELIQKVADISAEYLGWDEEKKAKEMSGTLQLFNLPD